MTMADSGGGAIPKERRSVLKLPQLRKTLSDRLTRPVIEFLVRTSITPNTVTWLGFVLAVIGAVLIANQNLMAAGILVLVAGFFDMLDGALARRTAQVSRLGGLLDSTLDRLSEAALLLGAMYLFAAEGETGGVLLTGITLAGSMMVSYIRARAEALGLDCHIGLFTRPERIIVLALGLLTNQLFMALVVIAVLSFFTVGQRLVYVRRQLKG